MTVDHCFRAQAQRWLLIHDEYPELQIHTFIGKMKESRESGNVEISDQVADNMHGECVVRRSRVTKLS